MKPTTDLVTRATRGDRAALEALLGQSAGIAHAIARAHLGDTLAAESAAADALRRVAQSIDRLGDPNRFGCWLRQIVVRAAANVRRDDAARAMPPLVDRPARDRGPVDTLVATERVTTLRDAIAQLDAELREPLLLHVVEELPYREIAAALDVGLATVSRRIERAREILRDHWEGDDR